MEARLDEGEREIAPRAFEDRTQRVGRAPQAAGDGVRVVDGDEEVVDVVHRRQQALGVLPQLRILWSIHVVIDVLFVAYVGTLVYLRNLAAEREMKVRFLPTAMPVPQAYQAEPALLLRRSN